MIARLREALARLSAVVGRRRLDTEFDEEMTTHIELLADTFERRGLSRSEARRRAILQMGGLNPTRDGHRESRGLPWVERVLDRTKGVVRDLGHAARSLARARTFTIVCLLSLGLGMGAFVALVTFFRAMTSPARGVDTAGLVELLVRPEGPLRERAGVEALDEWSYPDFDTLRQTDTGMTLTGWVAATTEVGATVPDGFDSGTQQEPFRLLTYYVSANYFETLGADLDRGIGFDPSLADLPTAPPVVVVSHTFWRAQLASDPDALGSLLTIEGVPHTIVGITSVPFRGPFNALGESSPASVLFLPLERHPRLAASPDLRLDRSVDWIRIHGRLNPGVDLADANTAVTATMAGLAADFPATNEFKTASVEPYFAAGARQRGEIMRTMRTVLGLAGLVLFIVCANLSSMMMVRGAGRERELSIRQAVGADRPRLAQYLFFEALWLAIIGGGLSVAVLYGIPAVVARYFDTTVPPELDFDATAALIAVALCVVVSLVLGLLPALRLSRPQIASSLKDDVSGGRRQAGRVHRAAVAIQVAMAVPFFVLSGVLLDRVRTADFGFDPHGIVAARFDPTVGDSPDGGAATLRSVRAVLAGAQGVSSVTMADGMPIDFTRRHRRVAASDTLTFGTAQVTRVAEGYLDTLGVRVVRGRGITAGDREAGTRVAVISEPLASRLFADRDAVGEALTVTPEEGREETFTIVGVTADFATSQLTTERPQVLLPLALQPNSPVYFIARGAPADERAIASVFDGLGRDMDLEFVRNPIGVFPLVVTGTTLVDKSLQDVVSESIATAVAGGIVMLLASLGVLGVVAYMVAARTRELALRLALGATRLGVVRLLLADVVRIVAPGIAIGLAVGAVLIHRLEVFMETPLSVGPRPLGLVEPVIYMGAALVTVALALLAAWPSARRVTSIQPMMAMRSE